MVKRLTLFLFAASSALYCFSILLSIKFIWDIYWSNHSAPHSFDLGPRIDIAGQMLSMILLLSCSYASWTLFKREKYPMAMMVSLFPIVLYLFLLFVPAMLIG